MAEGALKPIDLLATLSEMGVDFVVIGAIAVGVHSEVRSTGDVDVMVPTGDEHNKRVLREALEHLDAARIPPGQGGIDPVADDPYPTLMFETRYGKLDILYHPDGSDSYAKIKQRSVSSQIGGRPVRVVGRDDLIRMKLAAGREDDLRDVANLTARDQGKLVSVFVSMELGPNVDGEDAREYAAGRLAYFDPAGRARITEDRHLQIEARRGDLTEPQIERWAQALADRLHGGEFTTDAEIDVEITRSD
jgi:hypothetical protein